MIDLGALRNRLRSEYRMRILRPMLRHGHSPDYAARGSAVGLFIAFTPTVGVQIAMVVAVWAVVRWFKRDWEFNPVIAAGWTFVTNVFTAPPIYFLFVQTGRLLLGRWEDVVDYATFFGRFQHAESGDIGWMQAIWSEAVFLFDTFGLPMVVGCLPWALLSAWLGYRWTLKLVAVRRARRASCARRRHPPGS